MIAFTRLVIDRVVTRDDVQHPDIEAATAHLCRKLNDAAGALLPSFPGLDDPMALDRWLTDNADAVRAANAMVEEIMDQPIQVLDVEGQD